MKIWKKRIFICFCAVCTLILFSFSCSKVDGVAGQRSANTVYADTSPAVTIPTEALSVIEALQEASRAVSSQVLPSIVELDVVETVKSTAQSMNPFDFLFGQGNSTPQEYQQSGLGSGVIVRKAGTHYYVLTNNHVAGNADEITVKLNDDTEYEGTLVGADDRKDIALVVFDSDDDIPVAKLGDSDSVQIGDICYAMGTPLGYHSSVTQGIVSATGRSGSSIDNISDFIQTDTAINQGNSGGALVNIYGEVIGINTWIASQSGGSIGLGFSIPINNVKKAIDDFIRDGKVTYGWMGVSLVEVTKDFQQELGVGNTNGAFVANVYLDSPAAKGGLQAGDFVIELNGKKVKDVDQLVRDVGDLTVGEKAEFTVIRGGKQQLLTATIESREDSVVSDNSKYWPGFVAQPLTDDIRKAYNIGNDVKGVVVASVTAKSPAAALRLQVGDVITAVNDEKVTSIKEFYEKLDISGKKEIWFDVFSEGITLSTSHYKLN
ncbi:MAG: Do family serine endopeptidase [Treponema sp.]|nr:Do family serine endopeptidase [Candidatus Treponema caballi]